MPFITRATITETYLARIKASRFRVGFQFKSGPGKAKWTRLTYGQFHEACGRVAHGLLELGIRPGDRVALLSNTRMEWSLCDMAILGARGVTVPIYPSSTPEEVGYILGHCEARVCFAENAAQLRKILAERAADRLPALSRIIVFDPPGPEDAFPTVAGVEIIPLDRHILRGRQAAEREPRLFEENLARAAPGDLITICYTSGTTGVPKGVMITHDNMMSVLEDCRALVAKVLVREGEVILSFLPFSHILGKVESMAVYVFGLRQCFAENFDALVANFGEVRPTLIFAVPRVFEKAYGRIAAALEKSPPRRRKLFAWAMARGRAYHDRRAAGKPPSWRDSAAYGVARLLVFRKVRKRLGGRLQYAICGGAPLSRELGEYFRIVGVTILEGYGLTETCAPVAINTPEQVRFGTVGRPLPEVSVRIAEDGEILLRSRKVFKGYYKMEAETRQALEDGWFRTGDIGHVDPDGFLVITDRKKDLIVTSGGKNVAPQKIEKLAKTNPLIAELVVHGDRRNYLSALITLDRAEAAGLARRRGIPHADYAELLTRPELRAAVQEAVDAINARLPSFEQIKKFALLPNEFSVDSGELTPSQKVRRSYIYQKYRHELDALYPH